MKVMLIGGTGVLSKDIAKECIKLNIELYMINRGMRLQYIPKGTNLIIGDIYKPDSIKKKLHNLNFDVIVDFLSYTPEQLSSNLRVFDNKFKQYIFISSATAYSTKNPEQVISEETPLTNVGWSYSKNKIECEKMLEDEHKKNNLQYTIVRPYITYGSTRIPFALISKQHHWTLVDRILNDKPVVIWDDGKAICTLTHTEDFARGIVGLFGNPKAIGQSFHITSDEHLTWEEVIDIIGKSVNKKVKKVYIPSKLIEKTFPELRGELTEDKSITRKFDNKKIKSTVNNFECKIMFSDGIRNTLEHYQGSPDMMSIDNEWNAKIYVLINKYYRNYYPDKLNKKENLGLSNSKIKNRFDYIRCICIIVYYKSIKKLRWFIGAISRRIKKIIIK